MTSTPTNTGWKLDGEFVDFDELRAEFIAEGRPSGHRYFQMEKVELPKPTSRIALAIPQEWVDAVTPEMSEAIRAASDANIEAMMRRGC